LGKGEQGNLTKRNYGNWAIKEDGTAFSVTMRELNDIATTNIICSIDDGVPDRVTNDDRRLSPDFASAISYR